MSKLSISPGSILMIGALTSALERLLLSGNYSNLIFLIKRLTFRQANLPAGRTDHYANFWGGDTPFHSCEIRHHKPGSDTLVGCVTYPICGWSHSDCLTMNLIAKLIGVFMHGSGGFQFFTSPFVKKMQNIDPSSTFKVTQVEIIDDNLLSFMLSKIEILLFFKVIMWNFRLTCHYTTIRASSASFSLPLNWTRLLPWSKLSMKNYSELPRISATRNFQMPREVFSRTFALALTELSQLLMR